MNGVRIGVLNHAGVRTFDWVTLNSLGAFRWLMENAERTDWCVNRGCYVFVM